MDTEATPARDTPDDDDFGTQADQSDQNQEQPSHADDRPVDPSPEEESSS
jgi:hypothetical protein